MIKARLSGGFAVLAFVATGTAIFAAYYPSDNALGVLGRVLDSYSHVFVLVGFICAFIAVVLGARILSILTLLLAGTTGAFLYASYHELSHPLQPDRSADLRVLFFNVQGDNTDNSGQIVDAAIDADADILVFAESAALLGVMDDLHSTYSFVSPCSQDVCDVVIATNLVVVRFWQLQLNPAFPERYAVLEYKRRNGDTAFFVANHLGKPWLSGFAEVEIAQLKAQYNWLEGPVVVVGDYNMAPWSKPMRDLLQDTGMRALRGQHNTWPATAGISGLPIDQILVRDGPRIVEITSFGAGLGSNHLGFIADIAFPLGH